MACPSSSADEKTIFFLHFQNEAKEVESIIRGLLNPTDEENKQMPSYGINMSEAGALHHWLISHPLCVSFVAKSFPEVGLIFLSHLPEMKEMTLTLVADFFRYGVKLWSFIADSSLPSIPPAKIAYEIVETIIAHMIKAPENIEDLGTIFCGLMEQIPLSFLVKPGARSQGNVESLIVSFLESTNTWSSLCHSWSEERIFLSWLKVFYQCARSLILFSGMRSNPNEKKEKCKNPFLSEKMMDGLCHTVRMIHLDCLVKHTDGKKVGALFLFLGLLFRYFVEESGEKEQLKMLARELVAPGTGTPKWFSSLYSLSNFSFVKIMCTDIFHLADYEDPTEEEVSSPTAVEEKQKSSFILSIEKEIQKVSWTNAFSSLGLSAEGNIQSDSAVSQVLHALDTIRLLSLENPRAGVLCSALIPNFLPFLMELGMMLSKEEELPEALSALCANTNDYCYMVENLTHVMKWMLFGEEEAPEVLHGVSSSVVEPLRPSFSQSFKAIELLHNPADVFLSREGEKMLFHFFNGNLLLKNAACSILLEYLRTSFASSEPLKLAESQRHLLVLFSSPLPSALETQLQRVAEAEDILELLKAETSRDVLTQMMFNITVVTQRLNINLFTPTVIIPSIAAIISQSLMGPPLLTEYSFAALVELSRRYPFASATVLDFEFITEQFRLNDVLMEPNMRIIVGSLLVMKAMVESNPVVVTFEWLEILGKGIELLPLYAPFFPLFDKALWECTETVLQEVEEDVLSAFCTPHNVRRSAEALKRLLDRNDLSARKSDCDRIISCKTIDYLRSEEPQNSSEVSALLPVILNVVALMGIREKIIEDALWDMAFKWEECMKIVITSELIVQVVHYFTTALPSHIFLLQNGTEFETNTDGQGRIINSKSGKEDQKNSINLILELWLRLADQQEITVEVSLKRYEKELISLITYLAKSSFREEALEVLVQTIRDAAASHRNVPPLSVSLRHQLIRKSLISAILVRKLLPLLWGPVAPPSSHENKQQHNTSIQISRSLIGFELIETMEDVSSQMFMSGIHREEGRNVELEKNYPDLETSWRASVLQEMAPVLSCVLAKSCCENASVMPFLQKADDNAQLQLSSVSSIEESNRLETNKKKISSVMIPRRLIDSSLFTQLMRATREKVYSRASQTSSVEHEKNEQIVAIFDEVRNAVVLSQYGSMELAKAKKLLCFVEEFVLETHWSCFLVSSAAYGLLRVLLNFDDVRYYFCSFASTSAKQKYKDALHTINEFTGRNDLSKMRYLEECFEASKAPENLNSIYGSF